MYNIEAPLYPAYNENENTFVSTIMLPSFSGMQIRNGAYGAISEQGPSNGEVHAIANKEDVTVQEFISAISWIIKHDRDIQSLVLPSLVKQYWTLRDYVIEELIEENADHIVPKIKAPEELAKLCGVVAVHVGGFTIDDEVLFGIELGCNWEREHGAGVRFHGLNIVDVGSASEAFTFPNT